MQPRVAYSYIRFSTPEQRLGDSLRRQISHAEAWCRENKLTLDTTLRDEGVSGYRRQNATEGALAKFLSAIRAGDIAPGSVLVVESLDRLSRAEPLDSLDLLREIIRSGVQVVTLHDRQTYSTATMREIGPLLQALVVMCRAHEESRAKGQRIAESWGEKRKLALGGRPMTRQVPAWIAIDGVVVSGGRNDWTGARFRLIPERVAVLQSVFSRRADGWGRRRIADELNRREIPVWGRGKRRAKGGWQESYIGKLLSGRAVIGEFQPHQLDGRKSRRKPVGAPIPGYYPAAISEELWRAANLASTEARERSGRPSTSALLSGLVFDSTSAPMHVERKGDGCDYYATARAYRRPNRETYRWRLGHVENWVCKIVREINWNAVFRPAGYEPKTDAIRTRMTALEAEESQIKLKLKTAAARMLDANDMGIGEELAAIVSELKTRQSKIEDERMDASRQLNALIEQSRAAESNGAALKSLAGGRLDEQAVYRLRRELRAVIQKITLYPNGAADGFDEPFLAELQRRAAARLSGTQGLAARQSGRVCGAIVLHYRDGQRLSVWVPYRRGARRGDDKILGVSGVGYSPGEGAKTDAHFIELT